MFELIYFTFAKLFIINEINMVKIKNIIFLFTFLFSYVLIAQEGTVTINQDDEIEALLEIKKDIEITSNRYKIQIYSGSSRGSAESARAKFSGNYSDWPSSIEYETPNYKIWVGNFRNRLEADRALIRIKKTFINAFIFEPKKD